MKNVKNRNITVGSVGSVGRFLPQKNIGWQWLCHESILGYYLKQHQQVLFEKFLL